MRIYLVPGSISKDNSELLKHSSSKEKEVAQDKILVSRLRIQDEPYILMIHKETEYVAVLKADQDKSLSTLGKQVKEALIDALIKEGIRRDVAARFLSPEEDILYFEMNEKMDVKSITSKEKILKEMILPYEEPYLKNLVKKNINRIPVKKGKDFVIPIDEMIKLLEKRYGYPVIRQKAYTFQITCSHQIKNRKYILTAPEWFPVYQLHEVIGFLMGFEINEYWMEDYGRSVVSGNSLNKSMNSEEKEHTFADDDTSM